MKQTNEQLKNFKSIKVEGGDTFVKKDKLSVFTSRMDQLQKRFASITAQIKEKQQIYIDQIKNERNRRLSEADPENNPNN